MQRDVHDPSTRITRERPCQHGSSAKVEKVEERVVECCHLFRHGNAAVALQGNHFGPVCNQCQCNGVHLWKVPLEASYSDVVEMARENEPNEIRRRCCR